MSATSILYRAVNPNDPDDHSWSLRVSRIKRQLTLPYEWVLRYRGSRYMGRSDNELDAQGAARDLRQEVDRACYRASFSELGGLGA